MAGDAHGVVGVLPMALAPSPRTLRTAWLTSACYLAAVGLLAGVTASGPPAGLQSDQLLTVTGTFSFVALLAASVRFRAAGRRITDERRHDPYPAFALALAAMVLATASVDQAWPPDLPQLRLWLIGSAVALFAATGFVLMIADLDRSRVFDAISLSAIAVTTLGLLGWVGAGWLADDGTLVARPELELFAPVVAGVFVISLGLQALQVRGSGRAVVWLFLLAWTAVLVADSSLLVGAVTDDGPTGRLVDATRMMGFALLGAAALHPAAGAAAEPVQRRTQGLPRSQVLVLAAAVLVGPAVLTPGLGTSGATSILAVSAVLSLLVIVYLVRLVQGRAAFEHRAHHDELTGLANRRLLEERASLAIAHARRTGTHAAVLFLDLDRFKNVNDSLGHATGNVLLQEVAGRLLAATRKDDTVARLGGDEFVVVFQDLDGPAAAASLAEVILQRFNDPFTVNGHRIFASPSIGVASYPTDGDDAHELLENADRAMYRAKGQGRRRSCTYQHEIDHHSQDRLALESLLHTAIEREELRLHYQPKVQLPSGTVTGMEALLRWQHPTLGLLEPSSFITIAEESGLIVPIGEWALEEACRQNQVWARAGLQPLVVAVNLSLQQFQQQHIEDVVARVLRSTGLDPHRLELEVTESLALHDLRGVQSALQDLRDMGVTCSIDDFGTGYSGLSHLTQMPVDKLKIDKSFVATIDAEREAPIVVAVVALAHGLGLEVVAEGVETSTQLSRLVELGCDEMQGYLFSRPLEPDRFEELLLQESRRPRADGPLRLVAPPPDQPFSAACSLAQR
ncbi:MAG: putative bifunctional diguanylate cyclase/phosphodiesterase [Acidimicrobiales bacterium]